MSRSGSRSLTAPAAEALRILRSSKVDHPRCLITQRLMRTLMIVKFKVLLQILRGFSNCSRPICW